ncbi:hypothetical protein [Pararobbsia silviterrae]|uniref:Uncharacterized protein n=1 Tax=Pararobbsia silviterrae TaxID=1792498 RepID=A0A494X1V7_9BURK|nr:hypothetical protein [Pararobbsia silviterrae]RKP44705.1 hypothetical protein D7S86_27130 [Pararobbsia silviterrae]
METAQAQPKLSRAQRRGTDKASVRARRDAGEAAAATKRMRSHITSLVYKAEAHALKKAEIANNLPFAHEEQRPRIDAVFGPVESLLDTLVATGEIETLRNGVAGFRAPDGNLYPLAPALESVCVTYDKLARTHGWDDQTAGLRKLAKHFELDMPITQREVDAARASIAWMRDRTLTMTPAQISAEMLEVQIQRELAYAGIIKA